MKRSITSALVLSTLALSLSCALLQQNDEARTYYETLDLETPEQAVGTFTDAFQHNDFMTVYLVLAPTAQFRWEQYTRLLDYRSVLRYDSEEEWDEVLEDVITFSEGIGSGEHMDSGWYLFDQVMLAAKEHDALLIDLSGEVEIVDTEESETYDDEDAVDVIAEVDGIEGEVIFRTIQSPSDRWRVLQVIVPDGDEEMIPWSMPKEPEPIRIEASAEIEVPCSDDPPPPNEASPGQPYLVAEPTCGDLATRDDSLNIVPGTTLTLTGGGFEPGIEVQIWWEDPLGNEFRMREEGEYLTATPDGEGSIQIEIVMPYRLIPPSAEGETNLHRVLAVQEIPVDSP